MPAFGIVEGPSFWIAALSRGVVSAAMRANALVFFMFTTAVSGVAFLAGGIFTTEVMRLSAALFPLYAIGLLAGSRLFGLASEATYRRIAYASIIFVAIASMPLYG